MGVGKFKLFGEYFRAYSSDAYDDTMRACETLASASILLINHKSDEERGQILARAEDITLKISDLIAAEPPMVGALGLLTAVRVHERLIQEQAKKNSR